MPTEKNTLYLALQAARKGREVLLKYFRNLEKIEKKHLAGLVSKADKESEKAIFSFLRSYFPMDEFVGEESSYENQLPSLSPIKNSSHGRWIVDPLDGTTNYIHGLPIYGVSIGYEFQGEIVLGVIDFPSLGDVYCAEKGKGAFCNGKKITVTSTKNLSTSLVITGLSHEHPDTFEEQMKMFHDLCPKVRSIRIMGAATYDLCLVAQGVFDAYYERGLKPWDSAAGLLIVNEAGGKLSTFKGNPYSIYKDTIVASNSHISDELISSIRPHFRIEPD